MSDAMQTYEIRCSVHGFIQVNDWEWGIIAEPAFQRLRRIRQLAWTSHSGVDSMDEQQQRRLRLGLLTELIARAPVSSVAPL